MMRGDGGVDEVATEAAERDRVRSSSVPASRLITDDVSDQDRCELPGLGHRILPLERTL